MDLSILANELTTDPLTRGYSGMTDQQAADSLNTVNRTRLRTHLSGSEIYEALDVSEFQSKTADQKQYIRDIIGLGGSVAVDANSKARTVLFAIFAAGSNTRANLTTIATVNISRATELGLETVSAGYVGEARAQGG